MSKWFRQPLLSLLILLSWLLLAEDFTSGGHWVFGVVLALLIPRLMQNWWEPMPRIKSWPVLLLFLMRVLVDIIKGNIQVAFYALSPNKQLKPKFVEFNTELESDIAIYMLMSAIALAPGSLATCFRSSTNRLEVHVLHCQDEQVFLAQVRSRYEKLLKQVF